MRSWGPSRGPSARPPPKRPCVGEHQRPPYLGGDLGGTPAGSDPRPRPQPHKSQEQLGSRRGEKQLSHWVFFFCSFAKLFPLPFCFSLCRGTLSSSEGVVCHQSLEPPLSPQRLLFLPSPEVCPRGRRPSWVGSPGTTQGWLGVGQRRAQRHWQNEDSQRVGGIRIWSWCSLPGRRFLSSGYSHYTITQGQVPGSTEAGDKLLIVTGHPMSPDGRRE